MVLTASRSKSNWVSKHLILVGAGHAHLEAVRDIRSFFDLEIRVTVISPSPYQYYSGMGPGLLGGYYPAKAVRFDMKAMAESRGGAFITDTVTRIDPEKRLVYSASGACIGYEAVSFAIGSEVGADGDVGPNIFAAKPIKGLATAGQAIRRELEKRDVRIVVLGGGPAGVEIAANAVRAGEGASHQEKITLITGGEILKNFPPRVRRTGRQKLEKLGVSLLEHTRAAGRIEGYVTTQENRRIPYDILLIASGTRPPPLFRESGMSTGKSGGLLVNSFLQSTDFPEIFGGGDCIDFAPRALAKVGVYAVRENPVLKRNLRAALTGGKLEAFVPQRQYHLSLNMGDSTGISYRRPFLFSGAASFRLKDRIDRKFMSAYQDPDSLS